MNNWHITYKPKATKFLKKLNKAEQVKIIKYLKKLSNNPKSFGKALSRTLKGLWRYRIGDYRVICKFEDKELVIMVIDIGHRSNIYKEK